MQLQKDSSTGHSMLLRLVQVFALGTGFAKPKAVSAIVDGMASTALSGVAHMAPITLL
jgi:hypothetical protein